MNTLWILLALWIGAMAGFFAFALMAMARGNERDDGYLVPHRVTAHRRLVRHARTRHDGPSPWRLS
jgi:hypothetical protein